MALEYAKKFPQNTSHVVMIGIAPDFGEANTALAGEAFEALADSILELVRTAIACAAIVAAAGKKRTEA